MASIALTTLTSADRTGTDGAPTGVHCPKLAMPRRCRIRAGKDAACSTDPMPPMRETPLRKLGVPSNGTPKGTGPSLCPTDSQRPGTPGGHPRVVRPRSPPPSPIDRPQPEAAPPFP